MARPSRSSPVRVLVVTNVGPTIVEAYLAPLASLDEVREVVVVRDHPNVVPGPKLRTVTPPPSLPRLKAAWKVFGRDWLARSEAASRPPDLLMTLHWFPDGPGVMRFGRRLGVPVVANIIGSRAELIDGGRRVALSRLPSGIKRLAQEYQRDSLNGAAAITCTGVATREWFRAIGVVRPRLSVLHAAMDGTLLRAGAEPRDLDVVFVGRLHPDKRVDRLLRVLTVLGRRRPGMVATVVGLSAEELATLPSFWEAKAALAGNLRLVPWVESIADVLGRAKILLLTSDTEGRTLAVLEAMACGAVPVVTDVGDLREALDDGRAGILVPRVTDEETLADSLASAAAGLLEDVQRRVALATHAQEFVRLEHDPERTREEWRELLDAVLHTRSRG